jgi:hypothetical protein
MITYAISDLTTNNAFAGRSANRRMYQGYQAEPCLAARGGEQNRSAH